MAAALEVIKRKKWWVLGGSIIFIILLVLLTAFLSFYYRIGQYDLEGMERIEYIEYEGVPFSSNIKLKKTGSLREDPSIIEKIQEDLTLLNREKVDVQPCNKVLFFYHRDGRILNAYVHEDLLGFDFGSRWIRISQLDNIINDLKLVELIKVKEDHL